MYLTGGAKTERGPVRAGGGPWPVGRGKDRAGRVCYAAHMLDWIGSLQVRERTSERVVLSLSPATMWAGVAIALFGAYIALAAWSISPWFALPPLAAIGLGAVLSTLRRELCFDSAAGVLTIDQRTLGVGSRTVVPLFHLRAVVVLARPAPQLKRLLPTASRFVAYVDRRVGGAIYLDEARRCAHLMNLAEAIAEVADLRLEYDAAPDPGGREEL